MEIYNVITTLFIRSLRVMGVDANVPDSPRYFLRRMGAVMVVVYPYRQHPSWDSTTPKRCEHERNGAGVHTLIHNFTTTGLLM